MTKQIPLVERLAVWQRVKRAAPFVLTVLFVAGFLNGIYEWGYYRGYQRGSVTMRDTIMCVMERAAEIAPYKYCKRQEWGK